MKNNHIRTAWILSLVYCSKFYYELKKRYERHGKPKEKKAFSAYANLQVAIRKILCIELWYLSNKYPVGVRNTMYWIWGR
jgi:hypothetical protein